MLIGPDIAPIPDAADPWRERQLAILSELAEAGLEMALALKTRAVETAAAEPDAESARACAELTRAFDRASRAVRMAIALRDRLVKDIPSRLQAARTAAYQARNLRAERVRRIVRRVAEARDRDGSLHGFVDRPAAERLLDPDITGELEGRPIGALVARICADLGMTPHWQALSQEAWAQAEITERPEGSPYAAWPDLPPDDLDPDAPEPWDPQDDVEDESEREDPRGSGP